MFLKIRITCIPECFNLSTPPVCNGFHEYPSDSAETASFRFIPSTVICYLYSCIRVFPFSCQFIQPGKLISECPGLIHGCHAPVSSRIRREPGKDGPVCLVYPYHMVLNCIAHKEGVLHSRTGCMRCAASGQTDNESKAG